MRRLNLMNEKVIKAITLGLSAFMALQSPMAVLAADEGGTDPNLIPAATSKQKPAKTVNLLSGTNGQFKAAASGG